MKDKKMEVEECAKQSIDNQEFCSDWDIGTNPNKQNIQVNKVLGFVAVKWKKLYMNP